MQRRSVKAVRQPLKNNSGGQQGPQVAEGREMRPDSEGNQLLPANDRKCCVHGACVCSGLHAGAVLCTVPC